MDARGGLVEGNDERKGEPTKSSTSPPHTAYLTGCERANIPKKIMVNRTRNFIANGNTPKYCEGKRARQRVVVEEESEGGGVAME